MLLCLDIGNSHLYGGVFSGNDLILHFRHTSKGNTSDEWGVFLRCVLRENNCPLDEITSIAICSVVPPLDAAIRVACRNYFAIEPFFLQSGVNTGLKIQYRRSEDVGADRIANAIAATHLFPLTSLIVLDFGTATTFCAIDAEKNYLGGAILPGVHLALNALSKNTAQLPSVDIINVKQVVGKSTVESIQSGVFYGALGACRELIARIKEDVFPHMPVKVLATGGLSFLFEDYGIYDQHLPDLVLHGLRLAAEMNPPTIPPESS